MSIFLDCKRFLHQSRLQLMSHAGGWDFKKSSFQNILGMWLYWPLYIKYQISAKAVGWQVWTDKWHLFAQVKGQEHPKHLRWKIPQVRASLEIQQNLNQSINAAPNNYTQISSCYERDGAVIKVTYNTVFKDFLLMKD